MRNTLALGDWPLLRGGTLKDASLAYTTHGTLNADGSNAILIPTYYTGIDSDNAAWFGPARALDTDRYFIVVPNLFGNGISTSPSNAEASQRGHHFPSVHVLDNVRAQYQLLTETLGVQRLRLATGWSMGALQVYQMAASYPDFVENLLPFGGAARCSIHNHVFLDGVKAALCTDPSLTLPVASPPPTRATALKAFGRVYCGWAYSQTFFREHAYRELGFNSADALMQDWEADHLRWDAHDLLAMLETWQRADIAADPQFAADFPAALSAITARALIMPCNTDLYFPVADSKIEVAGLANGELREIDSSWGHCAASPGRNPSVMAQLEAAFTDILQ